MLELVTKNSHTDVEALRLTGSRTSRLVLLRGVRGKKVKD